MKAIILMFDSLNRHMLPPYGDTLVDAPNFARLAQRAITFDNFYAGSMPCMPARRELHTGRYNFLHRSWGPLEPFDDSMPELLRKAGIHSHLATDHPHYWEDGGATYHTRFSTWEFFRGQEGEPWKGVVGTGQTQDQINRKYMPTESDHSQTLTVDAGLHFIETNANAERWMLQIELFDPHEPFFTYEQYKDLYPHEYDGPEFDWPGYHKVKESQAQVEHARFEYAALVSMCDRSLGRVLDSMDEHDLWSDTLLIVNTDHGFLLGEHGWWAKSVQPWYNELVHLPMFLWDPRTAERDARRGDLAQTIDIAPTVLDWFGLDIPADMQGRSLALGTSESDADSRAGALFGIHGGHVNVTDGRFVYMRAPVESSNVPLEEYTLMPTHMRARFAVAELSAWEPADAFGFTKSLRTMRIPALPGWTNPWPHGTLLFDLSTDPGQRHPLHDEGEELRMLRLLARLMHENEAPPSQFARLGIPFEEEPSVEHLLVALQARVATAMAEPLPPASELPASDLLTMPIVQLIELSGAREVAERHLHQLVTTELVAVPTGMSVIDMAACCALTAGQLREFAADLAKIFDVTPPPAII